MPRSANGKTALEQILDLTVTGGIVTVRPYTKTSTTGKPVVVGAASRGAPGPKYGITNPGGSIRNTLSTGRQQNEANAEVASAMGSANPVTVGASTLGRTALNYTATAKGGVPAVSASALNAGARAETAGATQHTAAVAASTAAAKAAASSQAASVAAATSAAQQAAKTASSKPFITYPKSTSSSKPFTTYSGSSSGSSSSSSSASKLLSGVGAGGLLHGGVPNRLFRGGRAGSLGSRLRSAAAHDTASTTARKDAEETASRDAHETASRTAHNTASATAKRHASATAHATASATAKRDAEATIAREREARKSRTHLSMSVDEILNLQLSLKAKGYPVKVDGKLSPGLIVLANAYLKAAK